MLRVHPLPFLYRTRRGTRCGSCLLYFSVHNVGGALIIAPQQCMCRRTRVRVRLLLCSGGGGAGLDTPPSKSVNYNVFDHTLFCNTIIWVGGGGGGGGVDCISADGLPRSLQSWPNRRPINDHDTDNGEHSIQPNETGVSPDSLLTFPDACNWLLESKLDMVIIITV